MAHAGYWPPYDSFGEYGRQVLCALQFTLLIHHGVGRSYQLRDDAAAAGDRIALIASRHANGMAMISRPLPSPVRFIISAALNTAPYPCARANTMESKSFCVCSQGPTSRSRFSAWTPRPLGVFASLSCALQVSGTLRQKAIMLLSTPSFLCRVFFASSGNPAAFAVKILMS